MSPLSDRERRALRDLSQRLASVFDNHYEREIAPRLERVDHPGPVETDEPPDDEESDPEVGS